MRLLCQIVSAAATGTAGFFALNGLKAHAAASLVCGITVFLMTPRRGE